jgi:branched-chain amino acid transport system permease protein
MPEKSRRTLVRAFQVGLAGGLVAVLVCLVGMVEAFSQRDIVAGVISMGQTVLVLITVVTAYSAAYRANAEQGLLRFVSGPVAGLATGGLLAALVLISKVLNIRLVLVNASPALFKVLTFGNGTLTAVLYLLAAGAVLGAIATLIYLLPTLYRRVVINGLLMVALVGLLQDLLRVTLIPFPAVTNAVAWMFGTKGQRGLSPLGALALFVFVAGLSYVWPRASANVRARVQALPSAGQRTVRWSAVSFLLAALLIWPWLAGSYLSEVSNNVGLYILAGLGLNIVVGFAGLLDLGYVAFFAIGAYTMAILTTTGGEIATHFQWTFWQALPVAVGASVLVGVILGIPVLKIRGDYLAIVTLGFGEIIRILAISDFLKPWEGGSLGIVKVATPDIGNFTVATPQTLFYLILAGCLLALFIAWRLRDSRLGRAWKAIREDEDVAQAMGINLVTTKLMAFATGAAFSGLSGAIFAAKLATVYPSSFNLLFSINVLALIIVGGMGSLPGVVVGALVLRGLPELLREFSEFNPLIFGALLVVMMLNRPEGLWPEEIHRRELHQARPELTAEPEPAPVATVAVDG